MRARPALVLMAWAAAATPRCRASEAAQAFAERIHWDYAGRTTQLQEFGKMGTDGVIVLQEWWGVTEEIRAQASRISRQGYHVVVPDLYHVSAPTRPTPPSPAESAEPRRCVQGKVGVEAAEAEHLMGSLDWEGALGDIRAAAMYLRDRGVERVAVLGFCMVGTSCLCCCTCTPALLQLL